MRTRQPAGIAKVRRRKPSGDGNQKDDTGKPVTATGPYPVSIPRPLPLKKEAGKNNHPTDARGRLIKEIRYDSFGLRLHDSLPELFVPVGFAGGLTDPDTGFVRFGWRDYDPAVGRFTAPDPLGDTGGDHDVYEYCVDDPVSMCDPEGLIPVPLLFLAGKALALGLGLGGAYMAASAADAMGNRYNAYDIKGRRPGTSSTPAWDGMNQIAPTVAAASAVSAVPGLAVTAPGPVIAAA